MSNTDEQFIDYMKSFEASTTHYGQCTPCQNDEACATGEPIHQDFNAKQDAYQSRNR